MRSRGPARAARRAAAVASNEAADNDAAYLLHQQPGSRSELGLAMCSSAQLELVLRTEGREPAPMQIGQHAHHQGQVVFARCTRAEASKDGCAVQAAPIQDAGTAGIRSHGGSTVDVASTAATVIDSDDQAGLSVIDGTGTREKAAPC